MHPEPIALRAAGVRLWKLAWRGLVWSRSVKYSTLYLTGFTLYCMMKDKLFLTAGSGTMNVKCPVAMRHRSLYLFLKHQQQKNGLFFQLLPFEYVFKDSCARKPQFLLFETMFLMFFFHTCTDGVMSVVLWCYVSLMTVFNYRLMIKSRTNRSG